jgi:DNA-binding NtrC family response regulator
MDGKERLQTRGASSGSRTRERSPRGDRTVRFSPPGLGAEPRPPDHRSIRLDGSDRATVQVLIADKDHSTRESSASLLRSEGFSVTTTGTGEEALALIRQGEPDVIVLELHMPDVPGMELLAEALRVNPGCLVVVVTGKPSVESSIEALRAGAWDYLAKPFSAAQLSILMGRAAHTMIVARGSERRRGEVDVGVPGVTLVGESEPFRRVIAAARRVARTDASVFIHGESGTGKELIARFIHNHSRRSEGNLVTLNSAAAPETLLESEMFGHTKGAFTGAVAEKKGLLEVAHGGTLFLDEIADMPRAVQAKLLRVIQDGVVRRVGSTQVDAIVNVRFVAATNRDPVKATCRGDLRSDLFYRLWVVPIRIPPLRERPDDIPLLARHFLEHFWNRYAGPELSCPVLTDEAIMTLKGHSWPGNVRELRNVIEHAVVMLDPGTQVRPGDLPDLDEGAPPPLVGRGEAGGGMPMDLCYHAARDQVLGEFERGFLRRVVLRTRGKVQEAARIAGVDPTTLYRLMDKHGLSKEDLLFGGPRRAGGRPT